MNYELLIVKSPKRELSANNKISLLLFKKK